MYSMASLASLKNSEDTTSPRLGTFKSSCKRWSKGLENCLIKETFTSLNVCFLSNNGQI